MRVKSQIVVYLPTDFVYVGKKTESSYSLPLMNKETKKLLIIKKKTVFVGEILLMS